MKNNTKKDKNKKIKSILILLLLLLLLITGITVLAQTYGKQHSKSTSSSQLEDYDDSTIEIQNKDADEMSSEDNSLLNAYSDFIIKKGESQALTNPSANKVNFQYTITKDAVIDLDDDGNYVLVNNGEIIYTSSELIPPGKQLPWVPSDYIPVEKETQCIYFVSFIDDNNNKTLTYWFPVKITVQE